MQYTVTSRGRPIGTTDLGFARTGGPFRSGWFHPNAEGERLMPVITSVSRAVRAFAHPEAVAEVGASAAPATPDESTLLADVAEALQHEEGLELALLRGDGSVVPTSTVGIQDTEELLAFAELAEREFGARACLFDSAIDDATADATADATGDAAGATPDDALWDGLDIAPDSEQDAMPGDALPEGFDLRTADDEPTALPRYQIHVVLLDPDAIP